MLIVTIHQIPGTYDVLDYVLGSGTTLQEAMAQLEQMAVKLGGWGVLGLNITISEETTGKSWVIAYGTAISQPR